MQWDGLAFFSAGLLYLPRWTCPFCYCKPKPACFPLSCLYVSKRKETKTFVKWDMIKRMSIFHWFFSHLPTFLLINFLLLSSFPHRALFKRCHSYSPTHFVFIFSVLASLSVFFISVSSRYYLCLHRMLTFLSWLSLLDFSTVGLIDSNFFLTGMPFHHPARNKFQMTLIRSPSQFSSHWK